MKKKFLFTIMFLYNCFLFGQVSDSVHTSISSIREMSEELLMLGGKNNKSRVDSIHFFEKFPSTFSLFNAIYGDIDAPLYDYEQFCPHLEFLFSYHNIDSIALINKLVGLSFDAHWDADGINFLSKGMLEYVKLHICGVVNVLKDKSEIESFSFWHFIFDGPHPSNKREDFNLIYTIVLTQNGFQANLVRKAYDQLIKEDEHQ